MVVHVGETAQDEAVKKSVIEKELGGHKDKDTEESGGNADEESSDSDDDVPALEENDASEGANRKPPGLGGAGDANLDLSGVAGVHQIKQSRGEKKARKTLLKVRL